VIMFANTCFTNGSEFGYTSRVLKSGICKYYRRGEKEKFTWCVMEMAKFHKLGNENRAAKSIVTNLTNRLKILLMEEINCCEISRIYNAICILNEYDVNREKTDLLLKFCDIVCDCKRNRITSYVNNWWKHHEVKKKSKKLDKVEVYRKKGDSDELLELGENLIHCIEAKDETMFGLFMEMIKIEGNQGLRYRRREGSYLWWEIIENSIEDELVKEIWKFGLDRYMKKSMKERYYFGIWIGLMVWKSDCLNYECIDYSSYPEYNSEEYYEKMEKLIIDEYVIHDFHVNKSFGLEDFALNGAFVKDEDLSLLGENGKLYKDFYIEIKAQMDTQKKQKKQTKQIKKKEGELEMIPWKEFELEKVIEEGVCGGKVPCIIVKYKEARYILKEMKESMNFGKDYVVIDRCKQLFGLKDMNMKRIRSDRSLVKIDSAKKSLVKNWKLGERDSTYCMMDYWENIGDIGKQKSLLQNESVAYECLKIRLFDGLFMSSDNILRNILVNSRSELLSIDEGDMFGKRKTIFNKRGDWCKKNISLDVVAKCIDELLENIDEKKKKVCECMDYYELDYKQEFCKRIDTYKEIVMKEFE